MYLMHSFQSILLSCALGVLFFYALFRHIQKPWSTLNIWYRFYKVFTAQSCSMYFSERGICMIVSCKLYTSLTSLFLSPPSHSFLTRKNPKPSFHPSIHLILLIFIFHYCLLPFYPYSLNFKNKNYFPPLVVLLFLRAFFLRR